MSRSSGATPATVDRITRSFLSRNTSTESWPSSKERDDQSGIWVGEGVNIARSSVTGSVRLDEAHGYGISAFSVVYFSLPPRGGNHMPGTSVAERWRSLTREQQLSVGVLGVCGVIAIVFSIVRVSSAITRPFTTPVQTLVDVKKLLGPSEEELLLQQKKTDSDGDTDNIEIAKRTDPNCPKGKTCATSVGGTEAPEPLQPSLDLPGTGAIPAVPGTDR